MKTRTIAVAVMAAVGVAAISLIYAAEPARPARDAGAEDHQKLLAEAKQVIQKNLQALQTEDLDAAMATLHPKAPAFAQTRAVTARLMAAYDLKYELLSASYFGGDKDYLAVRIKQKTTKVKGPAFRDNVIDALQILRKDGGKWKIWQTAVLEIKPLDQGV